MTGVMSQLASGKFDVVVPNADRKDEIGKMASAVLVFRDAAVEKIRLEGETSQQRERAEVDRKKSAAEQAQSAEEQAPVVTSLAEGLRKVASGDLTYRLTDRFSDAYKQIETTSTP